MVVATWHVSGPGFHPQYCKEKNSTALSYNNSYSTQNQTKKSKNISNNKLTSLLNLTANYWEKRDDTLH